MLVEIKVPSVGESVTEAVLAQWFKKEGERVKKDEPLFVIETDKVTLEVVAETDGILAIQVAEGETIAIGAVVGTIDTAVAPEAVKVSATPETAEASEPEPQPAEPVQPEVPEAVLRAGQKSPVFKAGDPQPAFMPQSPERHLEGVQQLAPSVRRLVAEKNLDPSQIFGSGPGGRITKGDIVLFLESGRASVSSGPTTQALEQSARQPAKELPTTPAWPAEERITRKPMSQIRRSIAARLLEAKQNTAMLTTFNEIDMARVMAIRTEHKASFKQKYGVNLGIMSFFIKAGIEALKEFPLINAFIDGKDIIEHHYFHIGVAVGSERGLVVPVIRHADKLSFAQLEQAIVDYVKKINENRLELSDLQGGTFTITNGGVFGSLLSTPILNTPQSGILGMHKIEKRPVIVDDEVVIRPMMYVALSYDHRIVDGREAVTFLRRIKECVEDPQRMLMGI